MSDKEPITPTDNKIDIDSLTGEPVTKRGQHLAIMGLIASVALWILVFILPGGDFDTLTLQTILLLIPIIGAFVLCFKGRRHEPGVARVGMVVSGALLLFDLIGLVGCIVLGEPAR